MQKVRSILSIFATLIIIIKLTEAGENYLIFSLF